MLSAGITCTLNTVLACTSRQGEVRQSPDKEAYQLLSHTVVCYTCHFTGIEQYQYTKVKNLYLPEGQIISFEEET